MHAHTHYKHCSTWWRSRWPVTKHGDLHFAHQGLLQVWRSTRLQGFQWGRDGAWLGQAWSHGGPVRVWIWMDTYCTTWIHTVPCCHRYFDIAGDVRSSGMASWDGREWANSRCHGLHSSSTDFCFELILVRKTGRSVEATAMVMGTWAFKMFQAFQALDWGSQNLVACCPQGLGWPLRLWYIAVPRRAMWKKPPGEQFFPVGRCWWLWL